MGIVNVQLHPVQHLLRHTADRLTLKMNITLHLFVKDVSHVSKNRQIHGTLWFFDADRHGSGDCSSG